jgi:uncharacterized protein (DUF2225 family)
MIIKLFAKPKKFIGLIIAIFLVLSLTVQATTMKKIELDCPACDSKITAFTLMSTNTFGGQDSDFLSRASGDQPILIYPITCSACFYSGFQSDFDKAVKLTDEVKKKIKEEKVLVPCEKINEGEKMPAWMKYDLIAQTYKLLRKDGIAWIYIRASWAVRLSFYPIEYLDEKISAKAQEWSEANWLGDETDEKKNRAQSEVDIGMKYHEKAKTLKGDEQMYAEIVAILFLRPHGENTAVTETLGTIKKIMPEEQYNKFEKALTESISRERGFQKKAVALLEESLKTAEDNATKANEVYICGELNRRLENFSKAIKYYQDALKVKDCPDGLNDLIKEQIKLLPAQQEKEEKK